MEVEMSKLFVCPICLVPKMRTEDPNDANWVALGEVVCSHECHEKAYDFIRHVKTELPRPYAPP